MPAPGPVMRMTAIAVGPRDEQPALEGAPVVGPMDGRLARLEIRGAHVVRDRAVRAHLDPEVEGRHQRVGIEEALLVDHVHGQPGRLGVQTPGRSAAGSRTAASPWPGGRSGGALGGEHVLVAEDDDLFERLAQDARPDRPVAAQQALFPGLPRLGADEAPLGNGKARGRGSGRRGRRRRPGAGYGGRAERQER